MTLTLEIIGPSAAQLGSASRKVFAGVGGTIGRLPDNTWVVPDPYISARHARIEHRGGQYFLVDTSTNGVFVNTPENRLPKGQPYALKTGDRFFIDAYEIKVTLDTRGESAKSPLSDLFGSSSSIPAVGAPPIIPSDPFGTGNVPAFSPPAAAARAPSRQPLIPAEINSSGELVEDIGTDPLKLLGFESKAPQASPGARAQDLAGHSPLNDHYEPPMTAPLRSQSPAVIDALIPDDYDPLQDEASASLRALPPKAVAPRPVPGGAKGATPKPNEFATNAPPVSRTPAAAPPRDVVMAKHEPEPARTQPAANAPARGSDIDFATLLAAAGLQGVQVTPELAANFGSILQVVVAGLMDVLRARERIKDEFRIRGTTFKVAANNPLKFSANVEDALHNVLVKRNSAYLGPIEAFEDAFEDIRNHQLAMLAGVRVAFDAMLSQFDPEHLQEQFDKQLKKGSLLAAPARLRYWELYRDRFRDMVKDPESAFGELFGEEFARAYADQMERLKAVDSSNKK